MAITKQRLNSINESPSRPEIHEELALTRAPSLSLNNVSIRYKETVAIEGVNLDVPAGQVTALVGPSGCGKSSLLSSINRMTDTIAGCEISGEILVGGKNVHNANTDLTQLRRQVGMVFQQPNPFPLSIAENIRFPLKEHGIKKKALVDGIIETVLSQVGLWDEVKDRLDVNALQLSGGQQQRLCIARCLALKPEVILFDEPCSALDPLSSATVEALIKELTPEYTVLMVTHNLSQARRIADHMAVCWVQSGCGCIVESGDVDSIFEHSVHPITRAFCHGEKG